MKFLGLSGILICLAACCASADTIIDQEYIAPDSKSHSLDYPGDHMAQTFTVHNSGQLTSVGIQLSLHDFYQPPNYATVTDHMHFELTRTDSAGEPIIDDVLATYDIPPNSLTQLHSGIPMFDLDIRSQNVEVRSGDVLAIVLSTDYTEYSHSGNQEYYWNTSFTDGIAGGHFYVYSPQVFGPRWFYQ